MVVTYEQAPRQIFRSGESLRAILSERVIKAVGDAKDPNAVSRAARNRLPPL